MRSALYSVSIVLLAAAACAPRSSPQPVVPSAAELTRLEQRVRQDSNNVDALVRLGAAYRAANRPQDAVTPLSRAMRRSPSNATVLLLGATYEDLERFSEARALYESYLGNPKSNSLRRDLARRLRLVERKELELAAKLAVRRERELSALPSTPGTVAILPFSTTSADTTTRIIARALSDMLITDLSQTTRVTILERLRVQSLLNEIGLGASGRVDSTTAARSGRLLRAERVVQGSVTQQNNQLTIQAAVAAVQAARNAPRRAPVLERDALNRLFDLEKRIALRLYETLGVTLTVAEREAVEKRATQNLQALLAYGRGLQQLDAGNFQQAAQHFSRASALDPNFSAAAQSAAAASDLALASTISTADLTNRAARDLAPAIPSSLEFNLLPTPFDRDPVAEILGAEGGARGLFLELIFRRPGGSQ
jgi:TolB-like protein